MLFHVSVKFPFKAHLVILVSPHNRSNNGVQLFSILFALSPSGYDPIIRQHKSSNLKITALLSTPTSLLIGTSAGAVLALPHVPASPEPYPLLYPPQPVPLSLGHVDPVHFLSSIQREGETLVLSGGNGYEDFVSTTTLEEIPETASCLLIWKS